MKPLLTALGCFLLVLISAGAQECTSDNLILYSKKLAARHDEIEVHARALQNNGFNQEAETILVSMLYVKLATAEINGIYHLLSVQELYTKSSNEDDKNGMRTYIYGAIQLELKTLELYIDSFAKSILEKSKDKTSLVLAVKIRQDLKDLKNFLGGYEKPLTKK